MSYRLSNCIPFSNGIYLMLLMNRVRACCGNEGDQVCGCTSFCLEIHSGILNDGRLSG